jgi:hypothetical protein
MGRLITRLLGRRDEPEEQETAPIRSREVSRGPFAAGWVTNDSKLHGEPPPLRVREVRAKD